MKGYLKFSGSLLNKNAMVLARRLIFNPLYIKWHKKAGCFQPAGFILSEAIKAICLCAVYRELVAQGFHFAGYAGQVGFVFGFVQHIGH